MAADTDGAVRVPPDLIAEIRAWAGDDPSVIDRFVMSAVSDRLADLRDKAEYDRRAARGTEAAFARILDKAGAEPPAADDELPEGWLPAS